MNAVFVDATPALASLADELFRVDGIAFSVNRDPQVRPESLPKLLAGADIAIIDHTPVPAAIAKRCVGLRDVIFLGTGARSYMSVEELAALGIQVHTIKGYGDTAVAECAFAIPGHRVCMKLHWTNARRNSRSHGTHRLPDRTPR